MHPSARRHDDRPNKELNRRVIARKLIHACGSPDFASKAKLKRSTTNWPGRAAVRGSPSIGSITSDVTLLLSRILCDTRSARNPGHAGGGPDTAASPAFPVVT